jgi:sec-independent protein translocase protein TatA
MGDFAKGLKAFKRNMADDSDVSMEADNRPPGTIAPPEATTAKRPETTGVPRA